VSSQLRKIVDIGPGGVIYPGHAQDYRYHSNRDFLRETGTRWIRMWADWPSLQPSAAYAPNDTRSPGYFRLQALDEQIAAACADGLKVILMPYRIPTWANGTADVAARRNSDAEVSFGYADRMSAAAWNRYVTNGRDPSVYSPSRRALEYRLPTDGFGPTSRWARFFDFLYRRYHAGQKSSGRWVETFELVNEPNYQLWPQRAPSTTTDRFALGPLTIQRHVSQMLRTAQAVSARYGHSAMMLAPSCSDSAPSTTRTVTGFVEFTDALLTQLAPDRYQPHSRQAWSHHNYLDFEARRSTNVQTLRSQLAGRWTGYAEGGVPTVFITEGGARIGRMKSLYGTTEDPLQAQAKSVTDAWAIHSNDAADGGAGVASLTQYLLYADPNFDCGLLEPFPSTVKRPSYAAWQALPGR